MNIKFPTEHLVYLIFFMLIVGCSKNNNKERGYYAIKTLTNTLNIPMKVEIGKVTKKIPNADPDFTKNLIYRPLADLQPKETFIIDSAFVCTENCEIVFNEGDPEMEAIFLRLTFNNKVKIDTNCNHIYVSIGLIKDCQAGTKNYFNQQYHTLTKDESGNTINDYAFDNADLLKAE